MDSNRSWQFRRIVGTNLSNNSIISNEVEQQRNSLSETSEQTSLTGSVSRLTRSPELSSILQTAEANDNMAGSFNNGNFLTLSYDQVFQSFDTSNKSINYETTIVSDNKQSLSQHNSVTLTHKVDNGNPIHHQTVTQTSGSNSYYTELPTHGNIITSPSRLVADGTITWQQHNNTVSGNQQVQNSFGILPDDNISTNTGLQQRTNIVKSNNYGNYQSSQYSAEIQRTSQISTTKSTSRSSAQNTGQPKEVQYICRSPPVVAVSLSPTASENNNLNQIYRQPLTVHSPYSEAIHTEGYSNTKGYPVMTAAGINQTCILVTSPNSPNSNTSNHINLKEYRVQSTPKNSIKINNTNFGLSTPITTTKTANQTLHLVQTKAQSKVYPELVFVEEPIRTKLEDTHQLDSQDGAISYYTIFDGKTRQIVLANAGNILTTDRQTAEATNDNASTIIVPRRQSPQTANSQVPSPGYPIYNNALETINDSQTSHPSSENAGHIVIYKSDSGRQHGSHVVQENCNRTVNHTANQQVAYSSVITRALVNEPQDSCWESDEKPKKYYTFNSSNQNEIMVPAEIHLKDEYYDPTQTAEIDALQNMTKSEEVTEGIFVAADQTLISHFGIPARTEIYESTTQAITTSTASTNSAIVSTPTKITGRRRKHQYSNKTREELLSENEFLVNRIPPPAHKSKSRANVSKESVTVQLQSNFQQQNGTAYIEIANWSTDNNAAKIISSPQPIPSTIISPQMSNFNNQTPVMIQQDQAHSHAIIEDPNQSDSATYFHISDNQNLVATQSSNVLQVNTTTESSLIKHGNLNEQSVNTGSVVYVKNIDTISCINKNELKSKVVIPNIEEELKFLTDKNSETKVKKECNQNLISSSNVEKKANAFNSRSNFMGSFLKFLQGEREPSPPPLNRNVRRVSCSQKSTTSSNINPVINKPLTINLPLNSINTICTSENDAKIKIGQLELDKAINNSASVNERKRKLINENKIETPKRSKAKTKKTDLPNHMEAIGSTLPKKARPQMAMLMHSMSNTITNSNPNDVVIQETEQQEHPEQQQQPQQSQQIELQDYEDSTQLKYQSGRRDWQEADPLKVPPRRELSQRKAKCRGIEEIMQQKTTIDTEEVEEPPEFADSDNDPVWTPEDDNSNDEKKPNRLKIKRKRNQGISKRSSVNNILTNAALEVSADKNNSTASSPNNARSDNSHIGTICTPSVATNRKLSGCNNLQNTTESTKDNGIIANLKVGDFIINRSSLNTEWPILWQIDGKSILQKYEPFRQNEKILYKNMSTYAAWVDDAKQSYVKAPVRIITQNHKDTIVELLRSELEVELLRSENNDCDEFVLDSEELKESFKVYIQCLVSQSLDSSFFAEIIQEQDEYFLTNMKKIDDLSENCSRHLLSAATLSSSALASIKTWPDYEIINDPTQMNLNKFACIGCNENKARVLFSLNGQPYDPVTLQNKCSESDVKHDMNLYLCNNCAINSKRLHRICHQKYDLFNECAKKVSQLHNVNHINEILNNCLADTTWINKLFNNAQEIWEKAYNLESHINLL